MLNSRRRAPRPFLASNGLRLPGFCQLDIDADHAPIQVAIGIALSDQWQVIRDILGRHNRERRHLPS